jgi:hypothetical protein
MWSQEFVNLRALVSLGLTLSAHTIPTTPETMLQSVISPTMLSAYLAVWSAQQAITSHRAVAFKETENAPRSQQNFHSPKPGTVMTGGY